MCYIALFASCTELMYIFDWGHLIHLEGFRDAMRSVFCAQVTGG